MGGVQIEEKGLGKSNGPTVFGWSAPVPLSSHELAVLHPIMFALLSGGGSIALRTRMGVGIVALLFFVCPLK